MRDRVLIELTVYTCVRAYESVSHARTGIGRYIKFYNTRRPHSSLQACTPDVAYFDSLPRPSAEAA